MLDSCMILNVDFHTADIKISSNARTDLCELWLRQHAYDGLDIRPSQHLSAPHRAIQHILIHMWLLPLSLAVSIQASKMPSGLFFLFGHGAGLVGSNLQSCTSVSVCECSISFISNFPASLYKMEDHMADHHNPKQHNNI